MEATDAVPSTVIGLVAMLLGVIIKGWLEERREKKAWERLQRRAMAEIANPESPVTDPREAMEKVLVEDNHKRLRQASGLIKLELNGADKPKPDSNGTS